MVLPPAIVVHGLPHARIVLRMACPVMLLSAVGAPSYAGCAWWRAMIGLARQEFPAAPAQDALDCAAAPGRALEALSLGCRVVVLRPCPAFADIAGRAAAAGAVLLAERPPALDLAERGAVRRMAEWLGAG